MKTPATASIALWGLAGAFILLHFVLALSSASVKSPTADEYTYISTSYIYATTGDFRLDQTHPPLIRLLIGACLVSQPVEMPDLQRERWDELVSQTLGYTIGWRMLLGGENDLESLLFHARLPVMLMSCALALLIFIWAKELYGRAGGLAALGLYCLSPNLLAHARLATLDMGACLFMTLALYALYRYSKNPSRLWLVFSGAALGLAFSAKATGLLLLPAAALAAGMIYRDRKASLKQSVLCLGGIIAIAMATLALTYGSPFKPFYYLETLQNVLFKSLYAGEGAPNVPGMPHLNYAFYLMGDYSTEGWLWYSLAAMAFKTPVAALIALLVAVSSSKRWLSRADWFIAGMIGVILVASLFNRVNIGLRHVLPVYPLIYLYLGRISLLWPMKWMKPLLIALALGYTAASAAIYPDYLSFFNGFVGGAGQGHHYLDDSNLDWGQDLGRIGAVAEQYPDEPLYVATNWMFEPKAYGFEAQRLEESQIADPPEGLVAVGKQWAIRQRLNRRSEAYFDWIERFEPIGEVGRSIWIYRFPQESQ